MKNKKRYEKFLDALVTLLCNYTAISMGISMFDKNPRGLIEAAFSVVGIYIIIKMYDKE